MPCRMFWASGSAGIFRAHRHDGAQLGGNDIQPFVAVFADLVHDAAAAGIDRAIGLDNIFNPRQCAGRSPIVSFGAGLVAALAPAPAAICSSCTLI
jgi:hypothetical protein